eukprot:4444504-Alexandrium_andersonii.AAC.2
MHCNNLQEMMQQASRETAARAERGTPEQGGRPRSGRSMTRGAREGSRRRWPQERLRREACWRLEHGAPTARETSHTPLGWALRGAEAIND